MDPIKDGLFHIFTLRYPTPTSSPLHPTAPHGEIFELGPRHLVGCINPSFPIAAPHSLFTNRSRRRGQKLPRRRIASRTTVVVLCIDSVLSLVLRLGIGDSLYLRSCSVGHGRPALRIHDVGEHRVLEHDSRQYSPRPPEVHLPDDTSPRRSGHLSYVRIWTNRADMRSGGHTVLWSKT